jgi:hydrogenase maturation protease
LVVSRQRGVTVTKERADRLPPEVAAALDQLDGLIQMFAEHPDEDVQHAVVEMRGPSTFCTAKPCSASPPSLDARLLLDDAVADPHVVLLFGLYGTEHGPSDDERTRVEAVVAKIQPEIEAHGGRLEVVKAEGGVVTIRLGASLATRRPLRTSCVAARRDIIARAPVNPVRRVLVACVDNLLRGDDGFGLAVARRLESRLPAGVADLVEAGIGGRGTIHKLMEGYGGLILGTRSSGEGRRGPFLVLVPDTPEVTEPTLNDWAGQIGDLHRAEPSRILRLARAVGVLPERVLLVGCQPQACEDFDERLSRHVAAAVRSQLDVSRNSSRNLWWTNARDGWLPGGYRQHSKVLDYDGVLASRSSFRFCSECSTSRSLRRST